MLLKERATAAEMAKLRRELEEAWAESGRLAEESERSRKLEVADLTSRLESVEAARDAVAVELLSEAMPYGMFLCTCSRRQCTPCGGADATY